ncbi:MAG TPA: hypothetical protein PLI43_12480 [Albidovulum sp.]|uniref:hypothetical protein n=1 Tax=Albidovulum sp. TaxID=1872424 RepID=UPI002D0DC018|nr:hypothetical protein [Albidovulum sp.]
MCDCGKPSTTEAKTETGHGSHAAAGDKAQTPTEHAGHDAAAASADETCTCAPSGQGHHATQAGAATHA